MYLSQKERLCLSDPLHKAVRGFCVQAAVLHVETGSKAWELSMGGCSCFFPFAVSFQKAIHYVIQKDAVL